MAYTDFPYQIGKKSAPMFETAETGNEPPLPFVGTYDSH